MRLRHKWIFALFLLLVAVPPITAIETNNWPGPYIAGYEYKNGSVVDDYTTDSIVGTGRAAYNNGTIVTWTPKETGKINFTSSDGMIYRNSTFGSGLYRFDIYTTSSTGTRSAELTLASQSPTDLASSGTGNKYTVKIIYGATSSAYIYKTVAGAQTTLASNLVLPPSTLGRKQYQSVYFNSTASNNNINFTFSIKEGWNLTATTGIYSSGYIGAYAGFNVVFDNLSAEMPPGAGTPYQNGVNWTNATLTPLDGIHSGDTIVINDTTTRRHFTNPMHTAATTTLSSWDDNDWWIINGTASLHQGHLENITVATKSMVGAYDVWEQVNNTFGGNWTNKSGYLNILAPAGGAAPTADFACTPLAVVRNQTIACTDQSTNVPTSWLWWVPSDDTQHPLFTNSTEVTNQNPSFFPHYVGGYHGLCLTATNGAGSGSTCKSKYIWVQKPLV
jgi:hypothetical protein